MSLAIDRAANILLGGGVIAYPTEGVFGLGCMPDDEAALARLLAIKNRDAAKGLILIASSVSELDGWILRRDLDILPPPDASRPVTWIAAPGPNVTPLLRGAHRSIAVRITSHPVAASLCMALQSPLVSTSANRSGRPVVRNRIQLQREFRRLVDYIVPGDCGPARGPSEIRRLDDGHVLRPANTSGNSKR